MRRSSPTLTPGPGCKVRRWARRIVLAGLPLAGLNTAACDDGESSINGDADQGIVPNGSSICVVDPDRVAAREACLSDVNCPCGTHCELGQCIALCSADTDCGAGTCDRFGRCGGGAGIDFVSGTQSEGALVVSPGLLELVSANSPGVLVISAKGAAITGVRVVANTGVVMTCLDAEGAERPATGGECLFDEVPGDGGTVRVKLQLDGAASTSAQGATVDVHAGAQLRTVQVRAFKPAPVASAPKPGRYEGTAVLVGLGQVRNATGNVPGAEFVTDDVPATVSVPVVVDLAGNGAMRIAEPGKMISPHGEIFGFITFSELSPDLGLEGDGATEVWKHAVGGQWTPTSPSRVACTDADTYVCNGQWGGPGDWTVFGTGYVPPGGAVFGFRQLAVTLETQLHGLSKAPLVTRWQLSLSRTGRERYLEPGDPAASPVCTEGAFDVDVVFPPTYCILDQVPHNYIRPSDEDLAQWDAGHPLAQALLRSPDLSPRVNAQSLATCAALESCEVVMSNLDGCVGTCLEQTLCGAEGCDSGQTVDPLTGDLNLVNEDNGHPLLNLKADRKTGAELARDCLAEARGLETGVADAQCFVSARWGRTLGHMAMLAANDVVPNPAESRVGEAEAWRLTHRLVQIWLELEAADARELSADLRLKAATDRQTHDVFVGRYADDLASALAGWDVLLRPFPLRAPLLDGLVAHLTTSLDYRGDHVDPVPELNAEVFNTGFPVAMAETMIAQLEFTAELVGRAHAADFGGKLDVRLTRRVQDLAHEAVRRAMVVAAYGQGITLQVRRRAAPPPWLDRWDGSARGRLLDAIATTQGLTSAFVSGANPLGIDDTDVPLTFDFRNSSGGGEFTAITRYTFDQANRRLDDAEDRLNTARNAWADFNALHAEARQTRMDAAGQVASVRGAYGEQVAELCGLPLNQVNGVLDASIDPSTCFVNADCLQRPADRAAGFSTAEVGFSVCYAAVLRRNFGDAVTSGDANIDGQLDRLGEVLAPDQPWPFRLAVRDENGGTVLVLADRNGAEDWAYIPLPAGNTAGSSPLPVTLPNSGSPDLFALARSVCEPGRAEAEAQRPGRAPDRCDTSDACPVGMSCVGGRCAVGGQNIEDLPASCFRGELGRAALGIRQATAMHEASMARFDEYGERFDIALLECAEMRKAQAAAYSACATADEFNTKIQDALTAHNESMSDLRDIKLGLEIGAHVARGAKDCASAINKGSGGAFLSGGSSVASGIVECGAAVVETGLEIGVTVVESQMVDAETSHAEAERLLNNEAALSACNAGAEQQKIAYDQCMISTRRELVGVRAATHDVRGALENLYLNQFELSQGIGKVSGLLSVGRDELTVAEGDDTPAMVRNVWLEPAVLAYQRDFRRARQVAYLAARAAEYETQKSAAALGDIVAAASVDDLSQALSQLDDEVVTPGRSVCGTAPNALQTKVLSLRDDLLAMGDRSTLPSGWQTLSATDRFRARLASTQLRRFEDGRYVGQSIPFSIGPALLEAGGSRQCAERTWLVIAGTVGGGSENGIGLQLRQSNAFSSQSCTTRGELILGTVRPTRNLFAVSGGYTPTRDDERGAQTVSLTAFPRTPQALRLLDASNGQSIEYQEGFNADLAGRGIYGDYELLIPAEQLEALDLSNLEDILLRFDVVAEQSCPR